MGEHVRLIRIDFPYPIEDIPTVKYINVNSFDEIKQKLSSTFGNKIFVFDLSGASLVDLTLIKHGGLIETRQVNKMIQNFKVKTSQKLDLSTVWSFDGYYDIPNLKKILANRLLNEANELLSRL